MARRGSARHGELNTEWGVEMSDRAQSARLSMRCDPSRCVRGQDRGALAIENEEKVLIRASAHVHIAHEAHCLLLELEQSIQPTPSPLCELA